MTGKLIRQGYHPLNDRIVIVQDEDFDNNNNNNQQQPEIIEENEPESEGKSQTLQRDNFPLVELKAKNNERKEALKSYK